MHLIQGGEDLYKKSGVLVVEDIQKFLEKQRFSAEYKALTLLISLFDSSGNQGLDFDDFECFVMRNPLNVNQAPNPVNGIKVGNDSK